METKTYNIKPGTCPRCGKVEEITVTVEENGEITAFAVCPDNHSGRFLIRPKAMIGVMGG